MHHVASLVLDWSLHAAISTWLMIQRKENSTNEGGRGRGISVERFVFVVQRSSRINAFDMFVTLYFQVLQIGLL
jgi:hypothetical protein